ncbi:glutamate receptor 2.8-like [Hordeum vulgare subsp. vulgare]|uniref:glutamate receptor 2.8-like n=1 Tax=Hordeum vulgare subsp. vulgare TaxID=112509 RepID=UPI001D1A59D1|nr:glutamate receptor 2.8-like [Hordeum vulgare subsp. vulgare]
MERGRGAIFFLLLLVAGFGAAQNGSGKADEFHVGVILDLGSLVGKVARTSVLLAAQDFYAVHQNHSTKLVLHVMDSVGSDVQAASAAIELLENYKVQAIIGPQKSSEAVFISNLGNVTQVPIISFTATSPSLASDSMPYFVRATLDDSAQVRSISALVEAYGWREVVVVYEDTDYGRGILPYLTDALQEIDVRVPYHSVIPSAATNETIMQELSVLLAMRTRVFIVHISSTMASLLFTKAKEVGMMNKGFAWITTNGVANIIDSLNPTAIDAMNGVLGVRYHVPRSQELDNLSIRWNRMYQQDNPDESPFNKLSIVGLWGYDTIWALAQAAEKVGISGGRDKKPWSIENSTCLESIPISIKGPELLTAIVRNKFRGLSGDFDLTRRQQLKVSAFQIINVVGRGWRQIGLWSVKSGLSGHSNKDYLKKTRPASILDLNPVIWPGESTEIPLGWEVPRAGKKLRVGVCSSENPEFIKAYKELHTNKTTASGLSIDIFEEAVKRLHRPLPYEYLEFDRADTTGSGSYNDFVYQVYLQKYDMAVADITIRYNRSLYVDFTVPYTETGVGMIVPVKENMNTDMWLFLKPLSTTMWFGTIMFFMYTGVVVWLLEYLIGNEHAHEDELERFLARFVLCVWMVVLVILASSYTASFASMLTVQQLSPTVTDVHELQKNGECVGFHQGSYIDGLLVEIGFDRSKIKGYATPADFYSALSNGSVAAVVLEVPYIKLFLAKYNKGYTMVGPIYKSAGFAFVLPKNSPLRAEMSTAILNITGGDTIIQIEKKWIYQNKDENGDGSGAINFESCGGLFLITGVVTTGSLFVAMLMSSYKKREQNVGNKRDDKNESGSGPREEKEKMEEQGAQTSNGEGTELMEGQTTLSVPHRSNGNGDQLARQ